MTYKGLPRFRNERKNIISEYLESKKLISKFQDMRCIYFFSLKTVFTEYKLKSSHARMLVFHTSFKL
jgi:hypothetical protein